MTLEQTSAWAGLFYFCSRVATPGVESQSLITWPEGNGRLVQHMFEFVEPNVQLDRAVVEVIPVERDGHWHADVVTLDRGGRNPRGFHAERVIFAAPKFMARYVIRPYRENPPPDLAEFQFGAWMVANLTLRDRPKQIQARDFHLHGTTFSTKVLRLDTLSPHTSAALTVVQPSSLITIRWLTKTHASRARVCWRLIGAVGLKSR